VIEKLRYSVFGFDTFFVTGVENYEANGVLFKGNLRGEPGKTYKKLADSLEVWPSLCALRTDRRMNKKADNRRTY
jgi:hypothetical protein